MSARVNREIQASTIQELQNQVKKLTLKNLQLNKQLKEAQHSNRSAKEWFKAARIRSEQHRRNKRKLEKAERFLIVAGIIAWILNGLPLSHAVALACVNYYTSDAELKINIPWYIIWCSDKRIGGVLTGLLGFSISIPAQLVFPASWKSFAGATCSALKQILDVSLPS